LRISLTITDVTRMSGANVCIAGYTQGGESIRPVLKRGAIHEDWLFDNGHVVVRPFATIEFDVQEKRSVAPHTEDRIMKSDDREQRGMLTVPQQRALLINTLDTAVQDIFGATVHSKPGYYVMAGEGIRSLGTIHPKHIARVEFLKDRGTYQILFIDQAEKWWKLTVVDLSFREYARYSCMIKGEAPDEVAKRLSESLRSRYVMLRIGLSRGWKEYPDRCFLQITGVYSFPDYLEGRCFGDFSLSV
jgi:hypothetical protein